MTNSLPDTLTRDERIVELTPASVVAAQLVATPTGTQLANVDVPTQIANPSRASWRTFAQSIVAFLIVANIAAAVLVSFLASPDGAALLALLPDRFVAVMFAVLNGIVVIGSALSKFVSLLMANPRVNEWVTAHLSFLAPIKP